MCPPMHMRIHVSNPKMCFSMCVEQSSRNCVKSKTFLFNPNCWIELSFASAGHWLSEESVSDQGESRLCFHPPCSVLQAAVERWWRRRQGYVAYVRAGVCSCQPSTSRPLVWLIWTLQQAWGKVQKAGWPKRGSGRSVPNVACCPISPAPCHAEQWLSGVFQNWQKGHVQFGLIPSWIPARLPQSSCPNLFLKNHLEVGVFSQTILFWKGKARDTHFVR